MRPNFVSVLVSFLIAALAPSSVFAQQAISPPRIGQQIPGLFGDGIVPRDGQVPGIYGPPSQTPPPGQEPRSQSIAPPGPQTAPGGFAQVTRPSCGWGPPTFPVMVDTPARSDRGRNLWPGSPQAVETGDERFFQIDELQATTTGPTVPARTPGPAIDRGSMTQPSNIPSQPSATPWPRFVEPLSSIETGFREIPNFRIPNLTAEPINRELRQYGYSLFSSPVSTFAPVDNVPVGPDYILGPGDDFTIHIWGRTEDAIVRVVDRNGHIVLPSAGPVRVWGLTFSQAERLIQDRLSRYYQGIRTEITMGRLRTMRIYVVGRVCQPGSYVVSSLSTVINGLFAAGGPNTHGSLRNVQIKRSGATVGTLDLYDFLLRGDRSRDFRLESGDTIFVPSIGEVAGIAGEVKEPAIYELNGPARISDLIDMAGGLTPQAYLRRVQLIRRKPNSGREVIELDLATLKTLANVEVQNGDLVRILPTDPRIYNTVRVEGAVKYTGDQELKTGMRLTELLGPENVLPEADVENIEIARIKEDLSTQIMKVSLRKAWAGDPAHDVVLKKLDLVSVRSEFREPGLVKVEGEVFRPGIYRIRRGERLSSLLRRTGGLTDKAFLNGAVFTRRSVRETERKTLEEFMRLHQERLLAEASQYTAGATGLSQAEAATQQAVLTQRLEQLRVLASKITLGRVVVRMDEPDKLEGTPYDVELQDGDHLKIPEKPGTIQVVGSVRNPTAVLSMEDADVQYYLNRAGGVTPEADSQGVYLLKADGSAVTSFMRLRNIEPGDVIVVPPSTQARILWMPLFRDLATIAGQVAISLAALAAIL